MKKIVVIILSFCLALSLTACGDNKEVSAESTNNSGVSETQDRSESSEMIMDNSEEYLSVCDVDYISSCTNSDYLSFLFYNPDASFQLYSEQKAFHPEKIVVSIPVGENNLWNEDFSYAYDANDGYFNCIRVPDRIVPLSNTYEVYAMWMMPEVTLDLFTPTGNQKEFDEIDRPLYEVTREESPALIVDKFDETTDAINSDYGEYIFGDGWGYFVPKDESPTTAASLYIPLSTGADDSHLYGKMFLSEEISFNDETFTAAAERGIFSDACSYSVLENIDEIDKVQGTLGNAPKLSKTVFYQDLVAHYISENYGLNLRDKNAYMKTDPDYIWYSTHGYHVAIAAYHSDVPEKVKELANDSFSYRDKEGTEYSYYIHKVESAGGNHLVYIFRNDEITGRLSIDVPKELDIRPLLSEFFGRRP